MDWGIHRKMLLAALVALLLSPSQAQAKPATPVVQPASGKEMCAALMPVDFTRAGVPVSGLLNANTDDNDSAYCVYDSKAGKVEFDIFYPAGDSPVAVKGVEKTVLAEVGGKFTPVPLPGADSAQTNLAVPGKQPSASIAVRKNAAVFTVNIPQGPNARQQLLTLAQTVLSRLEH
jgi:hypothetical protein